MRRIFVSVLVSGSLAMMALAAPAALARPATQSTSCTVSAIAKFKPGLTLTAKPQKIGLSGSLSGCTGGGVTGGGVTGSGKGTMSCTAGSGKGSLVITWNTSETSTIKIKVDIGAQQNLTGKIVSGKFVGEDLSGSLSVMPLSGDCIFTPVTKASLTGPVSL